MNLTLGPTACGSPVMYICQINYIKGALDILTLAQCVAVYIFTLPFWQFSSEVTGNVILCNLVWGGGKCRMPASILNCSYIFVLISLWKRIGTLLTLNITLLAVQFSLHINGHGPDQTTSVLIIRYNLFLGSVER